jgi:hypothetical protein
VQDRDQQREGANKQSEWQKFEKQRVISEQEAQKIEEETKPKKA